MLSRGRSTRVLRELSAKGRRELKRTGMLPRDDAIKMYRFTSSQCPTLYRGNNQPQEFEEVEGLTPKIELLYQQLGMGIVNNRNKLCVPSQFAGRGRRMTTPEYADLAKSFSKLEEAVNDVVYFEWLAMQQMKLGKALIKPGFKYKPRQEIPMDKVLVARVLDEPEAVSYVYTASKAAKAALNSFGDILSFTKKKSEGGFSADEQKELQRTWMNWLKTTKGAATAVTVGGLGIIGALYAIGITSPAVFLYTTIMVGAKAVADAASAAGNATGATGLLSSAYEGIAGITPDNVKTALVSVTDWNSFKTAVMSLGSGEGRQALLTTVGALASTAMQGTANVAQTVAGSVPGLQTAWSAVAPTLLPILKSAGLLATTTAVVTGATRLRQGATYSQAAKDAASAAAIAGLGSLAFQGTGVFLGAAGSAASSALGLIADDSAAASAPQPVVPGENTQAGRDALAGMEPQSTQADVVAQAQNAVDMARRRNPALSADQLEDIRLAATAAGAQRQGAAAVVPASGVSAANPSAAPGGAELLPVESRSGSSSVPLTGSSMFGEGAGLRRRPVGNGTAVQGGSYEDDLAPILMGGSYEDDLAPILMGGEAAAAKSGLCPATLPFSDNYGNSHVNSALASNVRRIMDHWQLMKVTNTVETRDHDQARNCANADKETSLQNALNLPSDSKLLELLKNKARVDYRGVLLSTDENGEVVAGPNSRYFWVPKTANTVPQQYRPLKVNMKLTGYIQDGPQNDGENERLKRARERAERTAFPDPITGFRKDMIADQYRKLVTAMRESIGTRLMPMRDLQDNSGTLLRKLIENEAALTGKKLRDELTMPKDKPTNLDLRVIKRQLSDKPMTEETFKALKWINGDRTVSKGIADSVAKNIVIPIYAAKYLKQSLECLRLTQNPQKVAEAIDKTPEEGNTYVSGTRIIDAAGNCAYSPGLGGFVHKDLLERKAPRKKLMRWWKSFVDASKAARRAIEAKQDRDLRAFGISAQQAAANRRKNKLTLRQARLAAMLAQAAQGGTTGGFRGGEDLEEGMEDVDYYY